MAQPFALENLASKVGLSQKRAQQDYADAKAREGTNYLEGILDKMKAMASKKTGLFGFKGGGLFKTGLGMLNPALGFLLNAVDTISSQQELKKMIKKMGKHKNMPAKFRGTFLEDYLTGGIMGGQSQMEEFLKGRKQADLTTGLMSTALSGLSAAKGLGPLQKLDATKTKTMTSDVLGAGTKTKTMIDDILTGVPRADAGKTVSDVIKSTTSDYDITDIIKTASPTQLGSAISQIKDMGLPYTGGILNIGNITNPLMQGGKAVEALTTPGNYTPLLKGLLDDYLIGSSGEPVMTRAQAPKFY